MDVVVTDHHQPRADGAPARTRRSSTRRSAATRARTSAPPASPTSSRRAAARPAGRDPAGADDDLDLVALATVADCVPLRGENRRLVRAGLRALAGDAQARGCARSCGSRRSTRARSTPARSASASPRGSTPPAACTAPTRARAAAHRRPRRARRRSPTSSTPLNAERRHTETRILFEAEAQVARGLRGRAARPTSWPARTGTPASSGSSPRASPSATTARCS